jgi:hypothetical protein
MKKLATNFTALMLLGGGSILCAADAPQFSAAQFQAAHNAFMSNPIANAKPHCGTMIGFATESDDVSVMVSEKTGVVWMKDKVAAKNDLRPLLLCAYIAGNVKSQLAKGKKENDAAAGIKASIQVYGILKKSDPEFKLESMEKLIKADKDKEF